MSIAIHGIASIRFTADDRARPRVQRPGRREVAALPLLALLLAPGSAFLAAGVAWASTPTPVDVLVVYPQPAADHLDRLISWGRSLGETEMGPFLDADFAYVNEIYQQSGIDVAFHVVHHQEIDLSYIDPNWAVTLTSALMNSELGTAAYVPYLEAIESLRDLYAADIVVYWRDFNDGGPPRNGAGSIGGGADEAYVHLTYTGVNPPLASHEIGHLLGGQHSDGVQAQATYSIDGDTPTLREYRTVMTVAVPLGLDDFRYVWRFSNDGTSVLGEIDCSPLSASVETCDFTESAALGDASHDAVAILAAKVPLMAAFRTSVSVPAASGWGYGLIGLALLGGGVLGLRRRFQRT